MRHLRYCPHRHLVALAASASLHAKSSALVVAASRMYYLSITSKVLFMINLTGITEWTGRTVAMVIANLRLVMCKMKSS